MDTKPTNNRDFEVQEYSFGEAPPEVSKMAVDVRAFNQVGSVVPVVELGDGIRELHCLRCGHVWRSTMEQLPKRCPGKNCKSPLWNKVKWKYSGPAKGKMPMPVLSDLMVQQQLIDDPAATRVGWHTKDPQTGDWTPNIKGAKAYNTIVKALNAQGFSDAEAAEMIEAICK